MTTKEMIEVMEAFERGEEIEACWKGDFSWTSKAEPCWHWGFYDYRVKPKEPKFRVGDVVARKDEAGGDHYSIVRIIGVSDQCGYDYEYTKYDPKAEIGGVISDDEFILADECLWYWEFYHEGDKVWRMTSVRTTKAEALANGGSFIDRLTPLYALGFRLPNV